MHKKRKNYYIYLIIIVLISFSMGYAIINRNLTITGNSEVKKNTWDIHFDNVKINESSVTATTAPTANGTNPYIGFSFQLDLPGDFYEFTVDVKNAGTIDAMIDSITKTPTLTTSQAKYLNYIIEYQNGEQITSKQLVKAGELVRLKVRVEYRTDLNPEDLPTVTETLNLGFSINYVQADKNAISVKDNGIWSIKADGSLDDIGTLVTIGSEQFYTIGTEGDNVKLFAMYNLHVGNEVVSSNVVPIENPTGMQSPSAKGDYTIDEPNSPIIGVTEFSTLDRDEDDYNKYNGSIVEGYVNDYKNKIIEKFGINIVEARLIRLEELTSEEIGCVIGENLDESIPSWTTSTSYWLENPVENDSYFIWMMYSKLILNNGHFNSNEFGVRPVIVVPKSTFLG